MILRLITKKQKTDKLIEENTTRQNSQRRTYFFSIKIGNAHLDATEEWTG